MTWQDVKAWYRGEQRVGPAGARGRVYKRKSGEDGGPNRITAAARLKGTMKLRVYRVATGKWEDV